MSIISTSSEEIWTPALSLQRIKDAGTIEEVEEEIKILNKKDNQLTRYRPNPITQRRITNALQFAAEKIEIIKLTQPKR